MKYDAFTRDELISIIELRDEQIIETSRVIGQFNDNIEEKTAIIMNLKATITELNNKIKNLDEQLTNKDKLFKKYKKTITDNENNLRLKNDRIQELEMTLNDVKAQRDAALNANCHSGRYPWGPKPSRLSDQINLIEKRLNTIENYIFRGNKNAEEQLANELLAERGDV